MVIMNTHWSWNACDLSNVSLVCDNRIGVVVDIGPGFMFCGVLNYFMLFTGLNNFIYK